MDYRILGRSGVKVSPLCLGGMYFGWRNDEAGSVAIVLQALDLGINFIDTANVYASSVSEQYVGKALQGKRDQVVLATKFRWGMGDGPNDEGTHRLHIRMQVENSLRRLQTDRIDLYQMHNPDPVTPVEETLEALTDLVRQGKVLYIGTSNFPAWQLVEAQWVSERRNLTRFACEQPHYSLFDRRLEQEIIPVCEKYGIGIIPWCPLDGGWLTGKYKRGAPPPSGSRAIEEKWDLESPESMRQFDALERLTKMAVSRGKTISQFALAWLLANPAVTAPIIGPRTREQLEDNMGALGWSFTAEELAAVDEVVAPGSEVS
ncbi:MAG: aldo/keto reductase [Armatimonadetes bacterium]|nr:aldo/keto reductase [Armatimonadota bacterium]